MEQAPSQIEQEGQLLIGRLELSDIPQLKPILEAWIKDAGTGIVLQEEVNRILGDMTASAEGETQDRQYIVARDESARPIGVMGLALPDETMKEYAQSERPVEIINAFVSPGARGSGVGTQLLASAEGLARFSGFSEIIVNSGPRYKDSAWDFYDKRFGGRVAVLKDHYGRGLDAPVWRMVL